MTKLTTSRENPRMKILDGMNDTLAEHKKELKDKYNVREIGIFGSFVRRAESKKRS
ncbi:MAG: hypothetical protein SYNGOMJ08_00339 [Candidatus Syntrophoarchaeum sp. GoM_oil]|nr:MAG: hypothetical protein SYNGOMJ08_00339 [Candidatus Syntrophoarchaeum sp. GoM_oil]